MILLLHIAIAIASLIAAAYGFFYPSKTKLTINIFMIAATLISGTVLILSAPAHMTEGCMAGLFYTLVMVAATVASRRKLMRVAERA